MDNDDLGDAINSCTGKDLHIYCSITTWPEEGLFLSSDTVFFFRRGVPLDASFFSSGAEINAFLSNPPSPQLRTMNEG